MSYLRSTQHEYLQPTQHRHCWLLANGMRIFHLECCNSLTRFLDSWLRSPHPWQSYRTCLHHILLYTIQPCTMTAIWWCFIWMLCDSLKCSLHPAASLSRWGIQKWYRPHWSTNTTTTDAMDSSHFHPGTCFLPSRSSYPTECSKNST